MTLRPTAVALAVAGLAIVAGLAAAEEAPKLTPYGFVRLDAIYDDSRMQNPQFPFWVESEPAGARNDRELSIHPRLTRLGVRLEPMTVGDGTEANGVVEIDFQNGGKESREVPRIRHAYVQFTHGVWEMLAGQTWDLISPLHPAANADGLMWNAGNTGDRRPQFRVTAKPALGGGRARVALSAGMPNAVNDQDLDGNGQLDGLDAAVPALQALAEFENARLTAGVWGHVAEDRVTLGGVKHDFTGALFGAHLRVRAGALTVQGEAFAGRNASDVRAGIGQGIDLAAMREIHTTGGWGEAAWKVAPVYTVSAGATIDQPDQDDLADGMRRRNDAVYLVQHLRPWAHTTFGLELLAWETKYVNRDTGRATRVDGHVTFTF